MPSLRLSEIDDLLKDDDELTEIEIRRNTKKEKKAQPLAKYIQPKINDNNGGELVFD